LCGNCLVRHTLRHTFQMSVDWDAIDAKLPTTCTPDGMAQRKALFDGMDPNRNGSLTLTECEGGLPNLVSSHLWHGESRKFRPAVKLAFKLAKTINDVEGSRKAVDTANNTVDRHEFHALLLTFRQFLELDVLFEGVDLDGDRMLNWKEVEKALPKLESWNLGDRASVRRKFPDEWTESMKYEDFAEWCIQRRLGKWNLELDKCDAFESLQAAVGDKKGDAGQLLKAFADWDTDGNGSISSEELSSVLQKLDPTFTAEMGVELFKLADCNNDGKIDYVEFSEWITK